MGSSDGTRRVLRLAAPSILENLSVTLVNFADTAMVGSLGAAATASVAINASPTWFLTSLVSAMSVGGTAIVARAVGAGDRRRAERTLGQALRLTLFLALGLSVTVGLLAGRIPAWMGARPDVLPQARQYLRILSFAFVPHFLGLVSAGLMRGAGDTRTPMRINLLTNVVNVAGNFLLIHPTRTVRFAGLEFQVAGAGLGVAGAALATAGALALSGILLLLLLVRGRPDLVLHGRDLASHDAETQRDILRIGLPAAGERVVITVGQLLFVSVVAGLGTIPLAAHHLAITAESIGYMPAYGFGVAATTMVGQALGAGKPEQARQDGFRAFWLDLVVMSGSAALLLLIPDVLLRLFTPDAAVVAEGARVLRIVAIPQLFFGTSIVLSGALRGAGDTKWPLYISIAGMWGLRMVLAGLLARALGLGLPGAWMAMSVDLCLRGILVFLRFRSGRWARIRV